MTSIVANQYYSSYAAASSYAATGASTSTTAKTGSTATTSQPAGDTVELSAEAQKKLAAMDFSQVADTARTTLDALLDTAGVTSPLDDDGDLTIDLSRLDRRQLYAIAANEGDRFGDDEVKAAKKEMQDRFDAALAGPLAVARVTGDITDLYQAALDYLDGASDEEKKSSIWATARNAVQDAYQQTLDDPENLPQVPGDPVADYIARSNAGQTGDLRDFGDVASDARTALDKQYADAQKAGKELVFNTGRKVGQMVDFSDFDSRSLSAIALNQDSQFSSQEVYAAQTEMRSRSSQALLASFKAAGNTSDPTAFATNLISAYASMSPEERSATGWDDSFYNTVLSNYQTSSKIAQMFSVDPDSATGDSGMSLLNYL